MCHRVVKWILEMLGIPKHTKVQQHQSLFYYFKEETFVSWSHLRTPKFYNTNLIVFFFVFFFFFHILTNNGRKRIFVIDFYKLSLLFPISFPPAFKHAPDSFTVTINHL